MERERVPSSSETKEKIGTTKRGVPQSLAHREARRLGRLPKFQVGDAVRWFEEQGVVTELLGASAAYGDGRKALWYRVNFGGQTRQLLQEVLERV